VHLATGGGGSEHALRRRQGCTARHYVLGGEPQHGAVVLFADGELLHRAHAALANMCADTASLHGRGVSAWKREAALSKSAVRCRVRAAQPHQLIGGVTCPAFLLLIHRLLPRFRRELMSSST